MSSGSIPTQFLRSPTSPSGRKPAYPDSARPALRQRPSRRRGRACSPRASRHRPRDRAWQTPLLRGTPPPTVLVRRTRTDPARPGRAGPGFSGPLGRAASGHGSDHDERFGAAATGVGQRRVRGFVRQVLLAAKNRTNFRRSCVAWSRSVPLSIGYSASSASSTDRCVSGPSTSRQTGSAGRERAQVGRKHDPDHGKVCTSTDSTAGRSRTIGFQLSPASGDA